MSEEQNLQVEKKCNSTLTVVLVTLSLLFSIVSLGLSGFLTYEHFAGGGSVQKQGKKVVISKQYDRGRSLEKARETQKPIVVFFYTDWCGFCQKFAPVFDKITKSRAIKENFAIAFVNCEKEENHKHMEEFNVQGFPTVYVIKQDGTKEQLSNNTFFNDDSEKVVKEKMLEIIGK